MNYDPADIARIIQDVLATTGQATAAGAAIPTSARAAVLVEKERLELKQFPLRPIREDEILVRVEACGICGTDVHCFKNDPFKLIPVVLGHEGTGEVVQVGGAVKMDSVGKPVRVGDKIVTSTLETSEACMIAKYDPSKANLCDDLRIYGLLPDEPNNHFNGYFGEYLIIRPGSSFFVVNDMSLDLRVLIEPAAVAAHALERAKQTGLINFRSRVVVQGCGPIGLMLIAIIRTAGVNNIIAIDGNDGRLALAREMGADHTINFRGFPSAETLAGEVLNVTKGMGAHFAFSVTGVPQAASSIFKLVRRGGGVCEVGFFVDNGLASINPHEDFCKKEITLVGTWAYNSWEYPNAYHFLQRAARIGIPVEKLITHRFPLDQISEAFQTNLRQEGIKIVVEAR
ncbi:MAG: theronine dehydrogenase [Verrucomicrobiaceae bacterium]|nr:MAG: theronine dehydrogenase [Verrucomicrobiaceae bacterium]